MKRIGSFLFSFYYEIAFSFFALIGIFFLFIAGKIRKRKGEDSAQRFIRPIAVFFCRSMYSMAFIKPEIQGLENFPKENVILAGNHQSMFDIALVMGFIKNDAYFLGKKELEKIPLWGPSLSFFGIKIDRNNTQQAIGALKKVFTMLKEGQSLLIFPEGTRSTTGNLLPFMKGSLKIAYKSGVKILPFVVDGTEEIMPKGKIYIKHAKVKVKILSIVDPKSFTSDQELSDFVWNLMDRERRIIARRGESEESNY